jgi:hypothetical protein
MTLDPYKRPPAHRRVGLVLDDGRAVLEDGSRLAILGDVPRDVCLYADRQVATKFVMRGMGEAVCWNGVPVRWRPAFEPRGGVYLFTGYGSDTPALDGLTRWRDWLASYGASAGSIGHASFSLLRATLPEKVYTYGGDRPPIGEVVGGRQEAGVPAGLYGAFVHHDITAAYARTLGTMVYTGHWTVVDREPVDDAFPWPCMISAEVRVPAGVRWGPIPRRRRHPDRNPIRRRLFDREYPRGATVRGVWTIEEIRAAREVGAGVKVRKIYLMLGRELYPFRPWLEAIMAGRAELQGPARELAKATGNALWGRFALFGERTLVRWEDGKMISRPDELAMPPPPLDIAETVCARIRARVYRELLVPYGDRVLSVHTDGALVTPGPISLPEDWRAKDAGDHLRYLTPQMYAYRRPSGGTVYKVSGVLPADARATFNVAWQAVNREHVA